jgi:hypothetical protein
MSLSLYGWLFLICAWGAIISLAVWTMWKILFPKKRGEW